MPTVRGLEDESPPKSGAGLALTSTQARSGTDAASTRLSAAPAGPGLSTNNSTARAVTASGDRRLTVALVTLGPFEQFIEWKYGLIDSTMKVTQMGEAVRHRGNGEIVRLGGI